MHKDMPHEAWNVDESDGKSINPQFWTSRSKIVTLLRYLHAKQRSWMRPSQIGWRVKRLWDAEYEPDQHSQLQAIMRDTKAMSRNPCHQLWRLLAEEMRLYPLLQENAKVLVSVCERLVSASGNRGPLPHRRGLPEYQQHIDSPWFCY